MTYFDWLMIFIIAIILIWWKPCSYYTQNFVYSKDYFLEILTDEEVKDFAAINFLQYIKL